MMLDKLRQPATLIVVTLTCFSVMVAVIVFGVTQFKEIDQLRASLKSQQDLQFELLSSRHVQGPHIPHTIKEIAYVLNRALKKSSYKAPEGYEYRINSLGLRGDPIGQKVFGTKRVVIVGDSVVFGWKLRDKQRLQAKFESLFEPNTEFVTVGLPGWNTKDQSAFLNAHMAQLEPDVIIWFMIPNDVFDTPGVLPSGHLSLWLTPHVESIGIFTPATSGLLAHHVLSPIAQSRRHANLELIKWFKQHHNVPVILVGDEQSLLNLELGDLMQSAVYLPERLTADKRWRVEDDDPHPSSWANNQLAYLIKKPLEEILAGHSVTKMPATPKALKLQLTSKESRPPSRLEMISWAQNSISSKLVGAGPKSVNLVAGLTESNQMRRVGALYLMREAKHAHLRLELNLDKSVQDYPTQLTITLEAIGAVLTTQSTHSFDLKEPTQSLTINLPNTNESQEIILLSWRFDREECTSSFNCVSGQLVDARLF